MKQKLLSLIVILFFLSFVSSSPCFANTNESENLLINEDEHISMETTNIDDTVSDDSNYSGEDTSTNNTIEIDNNNVELKIKAKCIRQRKLRTIIPFCLMIHPKRNHQGKKQHLYI